MNQGLFSPEKKQEFLKHIPQEFHYFGPCFFCAENFHKSNLSLPEKGRIDCKALMKEGSGEGEACGEMKVCTYRVQILRGETELTNRNIYSDHIEFNTPWSPFEPVCQTEKEPEEKKDYVADWH